MHLHFTISIFIIVTIQFLPNEMESRFSQFVYKAFIFKCIKLFVCMCVCVDYNRCCCLIHYFVWRYSLDFVFHQRSDFILWSCSQYWIPFYSLAFNLRGKILFFCLFITTLPYSVCLSTLYAYYTVWRGVWATARYVIIIRQSIYII